jgi:predicted transcriptional regulator
MIHDSEGLSITEKGEQFLKDYEKNVSLLNRWVSIIYKKNIMV